MIINELIGRSRQRYETVYAKNYPEGQARKVYRVIEISGNDTLDRLCEVTLSAFDFIHEHMYEFSMSGRLYADDNYSCDPEYKGQPSTDTKLDKLGLQKGQIMLIVIMTFLFQKEI